MAGVLSYAMMDARRFSDDGAVVSRAVVRFDCGAPASSADRITVEEPLEIRFAGETLATTMRTPGHDHELAAGFLLAEGIVRSAADIGRIVHCGHPGDDGFGNVIDVQPAPGVAIDPERGAAARRGTLTASACGVCGRRSVDDLIGLCGVVADSIRLSTRVVSDFPAALARGQAVFSETGGLHAAALFDAGGGLLWVREDVGRHNAVDKVFGRVLLDHALPASGRALVVSGRSSFEIVQKAAVARVAVVVSVSAPSSLAIDVAERAGITLVGFARGASFNVYAHGERIQTTCSR
jgi:FdhD protein